VDSTASSIYAVDKNGGIAVYDTETGSKYVFWTISLLTFSRSKFRFERDFTQLAERNKASWVSRTGSYGIAKRALVTCALSCDEKLLVVAGGDRQIHILDPQTHRLIKSLSGQFHHFVNSLRIQIGHQEAVSGVTFRKGTQQLFSCGYDRTIKMWNLDDFRYTLKTTHRNCVLVLWILFMAIKVRFSMWI